MKTSNSKPPCPNCQSYKVVSGKMMILAIGAANAGCVGLLFMILIPPLGAVIILTGLALMLFSPFIKKGQYYCQNCQQRFQI